jgi:hypothetical protein
VNFALRGAKPGELISVQKQALAHK